MSWRKRIRRKRKRQRGDGLLGLSLTRGSDIETLHFPPLRSVPKPWPGSPLVKSYNEYRYFRTANLLPKAVWDPIAVTATDLTAHAREQIAGYKIQKSWTLQDEPLPLSAAGKVLKRALRQRFESG